MSSAPDGDRFTLVITPTARRQLTDVLPQAAAFAAYEFVVGPLLHSPQRVGKRLRAPVQDRDSARRGTYRVVYRIDEQQRTVTVLDVTHRRDAYRSRLGCGVETARGSPAGAPGLRGGVTVPDGEAALPRDGVIERVSTQQGFAGHRPRTTRGP